MDLKELRRAGLITERKDGRWVHFAMATTPAATPWIEAALMAACDDPQLVADVSRVEELRRLPVEDLCRLGYEAAVEKQRAGAAAQQQGKTGDCQCS